jgi:uncharacterized delta-60 repeat protein
MGRPRTRIAAVALLSLGLGATAALAAPGDPDSGFAGDGIQVIDWDGPDLANDVLIQPDGKIVTAGTGRLSEDFVVSRLNADGSLDASFGTGGRSAADLGGFEEGQAAALQADGKIIVVGSTTSVGNSNSGVARFNPDGSLDTSFDGDGMRAFDDRGADSMRDVLVQPDGKIVLVGTAGDPAFVLVARLNADGSVDPTFNIAPVDLGGTDVGWAAALQLDGKIAVAATTTTGATTNVAMVRLNANGSPDLSFDANGNRTLDYGGSLNLAVRDIAVQPDGKYVLAGTGSNNLVVTRLTPEGAFDPSFSDNGIIGIDFDSGNEFGNAVALQANGKIVVAGHTTAGLDAAVARFQPGGELDTTFSGDGKQRIDFGSFAAATAVAVQSDGNIAIAGGAEQGIARDALVARLEGDPRKVGGGPAGGGPGGPGGPGGATKVPRCAGRRATIVGTDRSERLKGTRRSDVIVGFGGNDRIAASGGNDRICAGAGNDSVDGGAGNDRVDGGSGKDSVAGGAGNDALSGGTGNDKVSGGSGKDSLSGGSGRDSLAGGPGRGDKCAGGSGRDRANCERGS